MRRVLPAGAAAVLLGGCGAPSADLFAVDRSGPGEAAALRLVVSDGGTATCNGAEHRLPPERVLQARRLARDLVEVAELGLDLPGDRQTTFRYEVTLGAGTIRFADTSRDAPKALTEVAGFTRLVAKSVCGLPR